MNIQHLKYAMEVERVGSITDAAENLFISQPSLSKALRELETSLGFSVFERTGKGMVPTVKGREMLNHAYTIMNQLSEIEALSAVDDMEMQTLRLSMPHSNYIAEAVSRFSSTINPQTPMNIRVREASSMRTIDGVSDGTFRLGIIRYVLDEESMYLSALNRRSIRSEVIWEYDQMVVFSLNNPLASRAHITGSDLEKQIEIVGAEEREFRTAEEGGSRRIHTNTIFAGGRAMQLDFLNRLPASYMWTEPMSKALLERYHLIQRPANLHRLCDRMIYTSDMRFTATERAFIDKLFEAKNEAAFDR